MTHYFSKLEKTFRHDWDRPALADYKGGSISFSELAARIEKFHLFFAAAGIEKGQKIALCARNTAHWGVSFISINTYEAVVVPLLNDFTPDSINHLVDHCGAVMLFTDADLFKKLDITAMPALRAVINVADFSMLYSCSGTIRAAYEAVGAAFAAKHPEGMSRDDVVFPKDNDKDICVINYTSGTTSAPKGVMLRYECFSAMVNFASGQVHVDDRDAIVSMLPMGHIYGLVFEFLFPLCSGCTIYYFGRTPSPTLLLKAMKDVSPYMIVAVPLVMEKIYKSSIKPVISKWYMKMLLAIPGINRILYHKIGRKLKDAFGGRVRHIILGGAALNPEVEKIFRKIRLPFTVGYGMTEASPLLTYVDWRKYAPGSCGKPVECCEVRIDSEDPEHIAGEILVRGTNICSGYYNNPEASANAFTEDGFFHTGDLGIMDKDGNLYIKGRSKNMILSANGQNIYPEELEAVINAQDYIAESVVVDRNSRLVALVYLDDAAIKRDKLDAEAVSDIPETIRINANRTLPGYSQISKVEVVVAPFEKTPKMSIKRFLYK